MFATICSNRLINPLGNDNDPANWRSSVEYQGTPGHAGIGSTSGVVVNEVLTHDDYPLYDAIELYNTTSAPVNIGGWYLSDSSDDFKKYRIPDGTILAPTNIGCSARSSSASRSFPEPPSPATATPKPKTPARLYTSATAPGGKLPCLTQ